MEIIRDEEGAVFFVRMLAPFDAHHHGRVGEILKIVLELIQKRFAGAIFMPNLEKAIVTALAAQGYHDDITSQVVKRFVALVTMYMTDTIDPREVEQGLEQNVIGVKYYPKGLTTNSENGVENPSALWTPGTRPYEVLCVLASAGKYFLVHAANGFDANGEELDPYDQEADFIAETLPRILDAHPDLKISVEHLSTMQGVEFMERNGDPLKLGCSLTAQHLLQDRRDTHRGGFRPNRSWWPIIQGKEHKEALRALAAKGLPFVWLGSDSAPHPVIKKEADCCLGGVMTVHAGIELYVEAFDMMNALDQLENFASVFGPRFYGIEPSTETIELEQVPWTVLQPYTIPIPVGEDPRTGIIKPFRLGESVAWRLVA